MANPLSKAAKVVALARATVPVTYVRLGIEIAEERGIPREQLLRGIPIDREALDRPDGRIPLAPCVRLVSRVWRATHDAGLGYEFGLRSTLAAHGNIGYGLLSHATVGESLAFGLKYGRLRNPLLRLSLRTEGDRAIIEAREAIPLGPMRQYAIDAVLVSMSRIGRQISGAFRPELELRFDCAEPAHFARYRHRLPPVIFSAATNELRFPASYLARPMPTGNASAAKGLAEACDRELALIGEVSDVAERVRALLVLSSGGYPDLEAVARRLHMSGRSLKRKLQQQRVTFQQLLEEARKRDARRLLSDSALTVADVAERMGYTDPASFTRAFRKWFAVAPSAWRSREMGSA